MRKKIVAMKKRVSDKLRKGMKATKRQLDLGLMKIKDYKKVLHHKWHVDTSIVAKWKHKVRGDIYLVKDLKSQVRQNDRNFKEMKAGLQAKFLANERDLIREDHRKLSKQKGKTKGEKQKEKWDKDKVVRAKAKAKKELKVMAKAVRINDKITAKKNAAKSNLKKVTKREGRELGAAESQANKLKLKRDLEKLKEKKAESRIS